MKVVDWFKKEWEETPLRLSLEALLVVLVIASVVF